MLLQQAGGEWGLCIWTMQFPRMHQHTPHCLVDQVLRIHQLNRVDDCDPQRWAGPHREVCISQMQVPCTHSDTPLRQGDQGRGIWRLLGVNYCNSQQWAGGDWEAGIQRMRVGTHCDTPCCQGLWWDEDCPNLTTVRFCVEIEEFISGGRGGRHGIDGTTGSTRSVWARISFWSDLIFHSVWVLYYQQYCRPAFT